jgi:integrase
VVVHYAQATSLGKLAPHDLRRTCAKLCRKAGGELEQIQRLLGHASIQTTERYLGTEQNLTVAVNDGICRREIERYGAKDKQARLKFVNANTPDFKPEKRRPGSEKKA